MVGCAKDLTYVLMGEHCISELLIHNCIISLKLKVVLSLISIHCLYSWYFSGFRCLFISHCVNVKYFY